MPSFEEFSRLIGRSPEAWQPATSRAGAEAIVDGWGHGSKGIVVIERGDGTAHAFNVVNDQGTILFLDGQTGALASFDDVTNVRVVRTNDWAIE